MFLNLSLSLSILYYIIWRRRMDGWMDDESIPTFFGGDFFPFLRSLSMERWSASSYTLMMMVTRAAGGDSSLLGPSSLWIERGCPTLHLDKRAKEAKFDGSSVGRRRLKWLPPSNAGGVIGLDEWLFLINGSLWEKSLILNLWDLMAHIFKWHCLDGDQVKKWLCLDEDQVKDDLRRQKAYESSL